MKSQSAYICAFYDQMAAGMPTDRRTTHQRVFTGIIYKPHFYFYMERKVALITGITGQDGSFLAEFLMEKGYDVHGTIRRSSVDFRERIAHLEGKPNFHLHYADLTDSMSMLQVVSKVRPTEIYNLAAQSHVQVRTRRNLRPTWMLQGYSVYWKPYVCVD
jgi:hypothetical protein